MTADSPRENPRRRPRRTAGGIAQLPWRSITNPFRPVEILSADQVETIHQASLRILREIGFEVLGDRAIELFAAAGAELDRSRRLVRLDDGLVETLVAKAPAEFRLHARNPARDVILGGNHLVFSSVGGPAFVTDLDRGRRAGNFADFVDCVKVISSLNIVQQEAG
ncbi:MAG: trimethylamine methyltransferase family protein, partial [Candidatus Limnocylindrales bacterium]